MESEQKKQKRRAIKDQAEKREILLILFHFLLSPLLHRLRYAASFHILAVCKWNRREISFSGGHRKIVISSRNRSGLGKGRGHRQGECGRRDMEHGWVCVCVWRFTTMILHRGHTRTISYRVWMRGEEVWGEEGEKRKCVRAGEEGVLILHVWMKTSSFQTRTEQKWLLNE